VQAGATARKGGGASFAPRAYPQSSNLSKTYAARVPVSSMGHRQRQRQWSATEVP
jgi:hypothetical protein